MKTTYTIAAEQRTEHGKNEARRLRVAGRIPAVVYGAGKPTVAVSLNPKEINSILFSSTGHNTIFNVDVAGKEVSPAMLVDWQHDPVTEALLHVDLARIDVTRRLSVKIPVRTDGEPQGVKQEGGLLEVVNRQIEIECLPDDIPERFVLDVRPLNMGQNLRAGDVPLGDNMTLKTPADTLICHVVELRAAEAEEEEKEGEEGAIETAGEPEAAAEDEKKE